ncbi:MAG: hypothetical protein ACLTLQ_08840 [[Clostridium] scindens]
MERKSFHPLFIGTARSSAWFGKILQKHCEGSESTEDILRNMQKMIWKKRRISHHFAYNEVEEL